MKNPWKMYLKTRVIFLIICQKQKRFSTFFRPFFSFKVGGLIFFNNLALNYNHELQPYPFILRPFQGGGGFDALQSKPRFRPPSLSRFNINLKLDFFLNTGFKRVRPARGWTKQNYWRIYASHKFTTLAKRTLRPCFRFLYNSILH